MGASERERRRLRRDTSFLFGLGVVGFLLAFALLGPLVVGDPDVSDFSLARDATGAPPGASWQHPLGADPIFRDVLARLAHGARLSLGIAFASVILVLGLGTAIGLTAGYLAGGRLRFVDGVLMRVVDVALAFPYLLLITAIGVAVDRADATTVVMILGLTGWTGVARVTRTVTMQIKTRDYVTAARALGAGPLHILRRHILPGVIPTLLIIGSNAIAQMILAEAVLGYLTVGIEPPRATWGRMLQEAESYIGVAPLMVVAPGGLILLAALGFTRLGDGFEEAFEPRRHPDRAGRGRLVVDAVLVASVIVAVLLSGSEDVVAPIPAGAAVVDLDTPRRGGVLRLASATAVPKLDPATAYDDGSRAINDLVFARLVTHDTEGRLVPELAERFAVTEGRRFTFVLREGLRFHDGTTLGGADVKRSLERTLHPKSSCPAAHLYHDIVGYDAFRADPQKGLSGVTTPDARTVVIELEEADVSFLSLLALGFAAPVCASAGAFADHKQAAQPCGAGPFKLKELDLGRRVVVERFDDYHEAGKPYLDGVEWLESVPARTQRYRFERGELDVITEMTGVDSFRYAHDARWEGQRHWVAKPVTHFIFLNTGMPPFDDVHLRRAVAFAVDPSVLSKVRANVGPTSRVIPPAVPGPARDEPMRRHDLAAALHEMELAGYPFDPETGEGGYPTPIDYLTVPDTFEQAAAEIFQQQLGKIGLSVRLELVSWAAWVTLITEPQRVAMGWRGWGADYPDPSTFFAPILTTGAITPQGSQNVSFYSNPRLDELVAAAAVTADHDARMGLFEQAEHIVRDEAPLVPVYVSRAMHLVQPVVRGYVPHPVVPLRVRDVWLARGAP